jgi:hypothetical protein
MKKVHRPSHDPFMIDRLHSRQMNRRRTSYPHRPNLAIGLAAVFILSCGFNGGYGVVQGQSAKAAGNGGGTPHATSGTYVIQIGGSFSGSGQASVGSGKVHISANVTDASGNTGILKADLTVTSNHFKGAGTVMGVAMVIEGRVDSADQKRNNAGKQNPVQIGPRIVANFQTGDNQFGRIFGRPNSSQQPGN